MWIDDGASGIVVHGEWAAMWIWEMCGGPLFVSVAERRQYSMRFFSVINVSIDWACSLEHCVRKDVE